MYDVIEKPDAEHLSILHKSSGVVYHYTVVRINEETESLTFDLLVEENPNKFDTNSVEFNRDAAFILLDLISNEKVECNGFSE